MSEYVNNDRSSRKINQRRENSPNNCVSAERVEYLVLLVYRWVSNSVEVVCGVAYNLAYCDLSSYKRGKWRGMDIPTSRSVSGVCSPLSQVRIYSYETCLPLSFHLSSRTM